MARPHGEPRHARLSDPRSADRSTAERELRMAIHARFKARLAAGPCLFESLMVNSLAGGGTLVQGVQPNERSPNGASRLATVAVLGLLGFRIWQIASIKLHGRQRLVERLADKAFGALAATEAKVIASERADSDAGLRRADC